MPEIVQRCKFSGNSFLVSEKDQVFYDKLNIPLPQLSPEERQRRRMAYRNERVFYKRTCDMCKKNIISIFHEDAPQPVYCTDCWWSDKWNALDFGREIDFNRPIFEQIKELYNSVPQIAMINALGENIEYANFCYRAKNAYMLIASDDCEDCYYSNSLWNSSDCFDCMATKQCKLSYELVDCSDCYECFYSQMLKESNSCWFCFDMISCNNCFCSAGLRHKSYNMFNKQLTKEEYYDKLSSISLTPGLIDTYKAQLFKQKQQIAHKYANFNNCENCTGNHLMNSKNAINCYDSFGLEDCKNITNVGHDVKDCYDFDGAQELEISYEGIAAGGPGYFQRFSCVAFDGCRHVTYTIFGQHLENCFGCISGRHLKYCILNKQYSKEQYEILVPKLIEHMEKSPYPDGKTITEWGEFFPISLSPFAYNETIANDYYPLSKEDALIKGFRWKEKDLKEYQPQTCTVAEFIRDVLDNICQEILACSQTGKNYRIIPQELKFYRSYGIPIPSLHPDQRHINRLSQRNPRKLWKRPCAKCKKDMYTTYSPERPENVFCETCYMEGIY